MASIGNPSAAYAWMNFSKYSAYEADHCGASEPPIIEPLVFIQPGALQGEAISRSCGIEVPRFEQRGDDVLLVVGDRKVGLVGIGLARRQVVVGIVSADGEIRCPHRHAQIADADPVLGRKQRSQQVACAGWRSAALSKSQAEESVIAAPKPSIV